jgi:hypothetical protein
MYILIKRQVLQEFEMYRYKEHMRQGEGKRREKV